NKPCFALIGASDVFLPRAMRFWLQCCAAFSTMVMVDDRMETKHMMCLCVWL
uniref:Uncharacterized protein n=1 Tax=Oryza brachyantha TaxID=4533 RepID=J3KYK5_ORYBR